MKQFLLDHVRSNSKHWKVQPEIVDDGQFLDGLLLVFGQPGTAIFAHMDTVGFTVRYNDQLVPIGSPVAENGASLVGEDSLGPIACTLRVEENGDMFYDFPRGIDRGTSLVFQAELRRSGSYIESPHLDNRLGLYNALKVAETLEDGAIFFSTHEEHGGGTVPIAVRYLYEKYGLENALVSDITWVTEGVTHGNGVVISLRDRNVPRRLFIDRIKALARESGVPFQLEVEGDGSSDGREVQVSAYPMNWCFVGAPEDAPHSARERVHAEDLHAMIDLYQYIMTNL